MDAAPEDCGARGNTIPKLATDLNASTRTIRRDLAALQQAGFPIYDDTINGTKFWRLETKSLGALARSGLTFSELCALYFSRALIECFAGTHLLADVQSALDKFESALTPQMKKFIDRLPRVVTAKPARAKRQGPTTYQVIARLLEAILHQRVVTMRYHSQASGREKDYLIHPYRLVHVQGGLYLMAFVPAYQELRTFAVERIRRATLGQQSFEPITELESDPFKHSLGAYRGETSTVQLRFHPRIATDIKERAHRVDDEEFYQLLDKDGITDDIHLFNEKLREWEDYYNYHRPHGALDGQTPYERMMAKTRAGVLPTS